MSTAVLAGLIMGFAAYLVRLLYGVVRSRALRRKAAAGQTPPALVTPTPLPEPAPPPADVPPPPLATTLASLSTTLSPVAEEVSHPAQLPNIAEFQAAVTALRRPDVTVTLLRDYALGENWPMACAALTVLAERPERQSYCEEVLRHLPSARPYVLLYAFRYLAALERRPPVGAVVAGKPAWWQENAVIPGFLHEFFTRCSELGDPASFGDHLDRHPQLDTAPMIGLLNKVGHPMARQLIQALNDWMGTRLDRDFLRTVGTLWDTADADPLLIAPEAWKEQLAASESALNRPRPRSVLVCGDPRVGKSAFIRLLAQRFQDRGWTIFAASGNELQADQIYIGQLEGRIRKVIEALGVRRKVIWYVRDLAQMASSGTHQGQSASILDQILPAMVAGNLVLIGEASQAAATRLFQMRPSLRSLIEVAPLQPMDEAATERLAAEVGRRIAEHAKLSVPEPTISATMDLAQHYLGSGQLPGVVLELLKRAADRAITAGETTLTTDSVVATLSQISGLPPIILDTNQRIELAGVRDFFTQRVMGQDEAVKSIIDRIAMLKAGLTDPGRPIGVFLFAGPTGTGKTELAKTLAEFLFGSSDRMIRLDMSEFQTFESTSKILGQQNDTGTESLIDRIRKQPFSVVLLDEFEKAHPNCWDLFLQIFDDGRLSDARGTTADFRHCIIILTSNLGATAHRSSGLGFRPDPDAFAAEQVLRTVSQTFRPEFVNRLDKIIVFQQLSRELMRGILHKELARIEERRGLRERAWAIEWEASAIEFLLDRGFSPEMGARPLKRAIDQLLLAPLAATLVEHRFPKGDQFLFVRSNGRQIEVEFVDPDAQSSEAPKPVQVEPPEGLSLAAIVLSPTGSAGERAVLAASWRQLKQELADASWKEKDEKLRLALADPAIWSRDDRHRVFSALELADRIGEASRTAERLFQRYDAAGERERASRELAGRLALQLHNLRQGMDDFLSEAPVDVLLHVDPALEGDAAAWCARLTDMYRQWAIKRRMRIDELAGRGRKGPPILLITGFGAFRTLRPEGGLHVLEDAQRPEAIQRLAARVTVLSGPPDRDLLAGDGFGTAAKLLAAVPSTTTIVRRYREKPAPLVRDVAGGWRSGLLDEVLAGDFDLIGASKGGAGA